MSACAGRMREVRSAALLGPAGSTDITRETAAMTNDCSRESASAESVWTRRTWRDGPPGRPHGAGHRLPHVCLHGRPPSAAPGATFRRHRPAAQRRPLGRIRSWPSGQSRPGWRNPLVARRVHRRQVRQSNEDVADLVARRGPMVIRRTQIVAAVISVVVAMTVAGCGEDGDSSHRRLAPLPPRPRRLRPSPSRSDPAFGAPPARRGGARSVTTTRGSGCEQSAESGACFTAGRFSALLCRGLQARPRPVSAPQGPSRSTRPAPQRRLRFPWPSRGRLLER